MGKLAFSNTYPVAAVGTVYTLNTQFLARSISIDNPSGMWLFVQPIMRYVSPFTTGWKATLPGTKATTITCVTAPVGAAASVVSGGPIVVLLDEDETDDYPGAIYNLIAVLGTLDTDVVALGTKIDLTNTTLATTNASLTTLNTSVNATTTAVNAVNTTLGTTNASLTTVNTTLTSTNTKLDTLHTDLTTLHADEVSLNAAIVTLTAALNALKTGYGTTPLLRALLFNPADGVVRTLIAAVTAKKIVPVSITITWDPTAAGTLRGAILVQFINNATTFAAIAVTPETPTVQVAISPAAIAGNTNTPVTVIGTTTDATTASIAIITMDYYLQ